MSLKQNEEFKENVLDEFQEALVNGDTETCNDIIKATKATGFSSLAEQLEALITDDVTFEPWTDPEPPVLEDGWREDYLERGKTYKEEEESARLEEAHLRSLEK